MNKTVTNVIKFILAYICTLIIGVVTGYGITRIDVILPLLCILFYFLFDFLYEKFAIKSKDFALKRALSLTDYSADDIKSDLKYALPLAIIFALSVAVGRHMLVWDDVITPFAILDIPIFVTVTLFVTWLMIILFRSIDRQNDSIDKCQKSTITNDKSSEKSEYASAATSIHAKELLVYAGIFILCWLPYYLTLYPGNLGKDTFESIDMVLGNIPWTNHHPIFFTLLIGAVIKFTSGLSLTGSMAVFTVVHMTVFALTCSYITLYVKYREINIDAKRLRLSSITALFFALHPFMPMYSIYITKDVLFSCALAVFVLKLTEFNRFNMNGVTNNDANVQNSKSVMNYHICLGILSLFVMLLRNNGLMIIAILAIIITVKESANNISGSDSNAKTDNGNKWLKGLLISFVIPIIIFLTFKSVSYNVLNVQPESFAESASVPLQQVGYVIKNHSDEEVASVLTKEQDEILKTIMPYDDVRRAYDLGYTDPLKFDEAFDDEYFNAHSSDYMKTWCKLLMHYPGDYIASYLAQTAGYWQYGQTNTVATQGVWEDNTVGVNRIDIIEKMTGVSLYGIIEKLMLGMRKAPLLCILSSMAMQFYAVILALITYKRKMVRPKDADATEQRKDSVAIALTPLILLWVSIMIATPAFCLFRYTFAMFMLWPVTIGIIVRKLR